MKEKKKQIGILLPETWLSRLERLAKATGRTRSGYIRHLICLHLRALDQGEVFPEEQ